MSRRMPLPQTASFVSELSTPLSATLSSSSFRKRIRQEVHNATAHNLAPDLEAAEVQFEVERLIEDLDPGTVVGRDLAASLVRRAIGNLRLRSPQSTNARLAALHLGPQWQKQYAAVMHDAALDVFYRPIVNGEPNVGSRSTIIGWDEAGTLLAEILPFNRDVAMAVQDEFYKRLEQKGLPMIDTSIAFPESDQP